MLLITPIGGKRFLHEWALLSERQALRHTKAVLLIDDHQGQVFKVHLLLNHRVGANHQGGHPRLNVGQSLEFFGFLLTAREPDHFAAQGGQTRLQPV